MLLEQNKAGQFISHLCQFKIPNKLNIFTNVEDYGSKFFIDNKPFSANQNTKNSIYKHITRFDEWNN